MKNHVFTLVKTRILLAILCTLTFIPSYATWSIIAVDRTTGEIGIAGASCTFDVSGIASIVPEKGAIVVQAASNYFARMKAVELMMADANPNEILNVLKNKDFDPEKQQYAFISLSEGAKPIVYSGEEITNWSGFKIATDVAVQGNILVDENVISSAFEAFQGSEGKSLNERLMLALEAGASAGGDKRCGKQHARSAFLMVYDPKTKSINKLSVFGINKDGKPAVSLLKKKFEKSMSYHPSIPPFKTHFKNYEGKSFSNFLGKGSLTSTIDSVNGCVKFKLYACKYNPFPFKIRSSRLYC